MSQLFETKEHTRRILQIIQNDTLALNSIVGSVNEITSTLCFLTATNPAVMDARMSLIENQLRS